MRIVIDMQGAQTESRFRGIGRYSMSFAQAVVRNRGQHEVILALSGLFPETIQPIRSSFADLLPQENIRVWYAPGPVTEGNEGNEIRREIAELMREAFLASLRPDVVHISSLFEGYVDDAVSSVGKFDQNTPISVSLYDLIPLVNPEHYLDPCPRYAEYYHRKVRYLEQASTLLAISDFARQEGRAHLTTETTQIINVSTAIGSQFQNFNFAEENVSVFLQNYGLQRPFVLYTGGSDERKNLPRLIKAYAALPIGIRKNRHLLFAGKMPVGDVAQFRQIAKIAGLQKDELLFTDYVTDEELVKLYNLCELYVFPSWHEGFGLPALEAMACGAPVIGANTSSLPEVIGLNEALFDPMDTTSIAEKMEQALRDNRLCDRLRVHGRQQVKKFSWDETARKAFTAWSGIPPHERLNCKQEIKQKLAFVSPLPPERTGIADYSAELLPALSEYYDISLITDQTIVDALSVPVPFQIKNVSWFRENSAQFDRVLYQVGNSPFHEHMLSLIRDIPGTVVLHDFFLSGLMSWLDSSDEVANTWTEKLYQQHGYHAVQEKILSSENARIKYPVSFEIFQYAQGVIVHSELAKSLCTQWYGDQFGQGCQVIPLLRQEKSIKKKFELKVALGFNKKDFIVCSFGFVDPTKLNHRLLDCWLASALAEDKRCHLVFVGQNHGGDYGAELLSTIKRSGLEKRIKITGFATAELFEQYLGAADVAVQLRAQSRGETSAAVLDCMNYAVPTVVNANGSMGELNPEASRILPDEFENSQLTVAIEDLWKSPEKRQSTGEKARKIIVEVHSPVKCAARYTAAIEEFYYHSKTSFRELIQSIAAKGLHKLDQKGLVELSQSIANSLPLAKPAKRFFVDITATCNTDLKTGIERVARALLLAILENPPNGYRIEPIYLHHEDGVWTHRYARKYTLSLLNCPEGLLDNDEVVVPEAGDLLLGLDISGAQLVQASQSGLFARYRRGGAEIYYMVYDLLPIRMPEVFPPNTSLSHEQWLTTVAEFDGVICISESVAKDFRCWLSETNGLIKNEHRLHIASIPLGADISNSAPSSGLPETAEVTLEKMQSRPTFLMVGTIEPRKGYLQTVEAFTHLWQDNNNDINLVVVGREGWQGLSDDLRRDIPETIYKLQHHPELGKRLFWMDGVSDEYLENIYATSTCLLAVSYGEGFGLPLIEAAQHGLPIIARDIPVFREVAGEHAYYFSDSKSVDLSIVIEQWMNLHRENKHPSSMGMPWATWKESASVLGDLLLNRYEGKQ